MSGDANRQSHDTQRQERLYPKVVRKRDKPRKSQTPVIHHPLVKVYLAIQGSIHFRVISGMLLTARLLGQPSRERQGTRVPLGSNEPAEPAPILPLDVGQEELRREDPPEERAEERRGPA